MSLFLKTEKVVGPIFKQDGCIVWNVHNTVFDSKRSTICATVSDGGRYVTMPNDGNYCAAVEPEMSEC